MQRKPMPWRISRITRRRTRDRHPLPTQTIHLAAAMNAAALLFYKKQSGIYRTALLFLNILKLVMFAEKGEKVTNKRIGKKSRIHNSDNCYDVSGECGSQYQ